MFEKIQIQGFRRLANVELKLAPLNVLIGANGCGKTSLLDVFSLLADSASGRLSRSIGDLGGIVSNLTDLQTGQREKASSMTFRLTEDGITVTISRASTRRNRRFPKLPRLKRNPTLFAGNSLPQPLIKFSTWVSDHRFVYLNRCARRPCRALTARILFRVSTHLEKPIPIDLRRWKQRFRRVFQRSNG